MNGNAFKRLFVFIIVGMVGWPFLWYGYKFYWQNTTKRLYEKAENVYTKRYAYVEFRGKLRQVIYGTSLEKGQQLRNYYAQKKKFYKELKEGKRTWDKEVIDGDTALFTGIHIPNSVDIRYIGVQKPIYIKDKEDSVAHILVFDTTCLGIL